MTPENRRNGLMLVGGVLLAYAGITYLSAAPAGKPAPTPAPGPQPTPTPGTPQPCKQPANVGNVVSKLIANSRFYNWSDLRTLPLNPNDPHTWSTGGTTAELGAGIGYQFAWIEAKYGVAGDGTSGYFVRLTNWNNTGGDWALPAVPLGLANPCTAELYLRGQLYYTF